MANRTREKIIALLLIATVSKGSNDPCSNEWSDSTCLMDVFFEGKCGSIHYESDYCRATCGYCTKTNTHTASNLARITHPTSKPTTKTWTTRSTESATIAPSFVPHLKTTSFIVNTSVTVAPPVMIDGKWGEWSAWSSCTSTCGLAIRKRIRQCDSPPPTNG
ncbi:hypothetical protein ACJMK2_029783, partial [Sinanodonta woodiana]